MGGGASTSHHPAPIGMPEQDYNPKDPNEFQMQLAYGTGVSTPDVRSTQKSGFDETKADNVHSSVMGILNAAKEGHLHNVSALLEVENVNLEVHTENGWTALMYAIENCHVPMVELLLSKGAKVAVYDFSDKMTALHHAVAKGNLKIVVLLVDHGAEIEAEDRKGRSPLFLAATFGHYPIVEYLVGKGANIEHPTPMKETPFYEAVDRGHLDIVQYLESKGANIFMRTKVSVSIVNSPSAPIVREHIY
jgi:uncharacterized protein